MRAAIYDSYQTEETKVMQEVHKRGYREPITLMIQEVYTNKKNEQMDLAESILSTVHMGEQASESHWTGSLTDAIIQLEHQILQLEPTRYKDVSLDILENDTYTWSTVKPIRTKAAVPKKANMFNTPMAKSNKEQALNTYQRVPAAEQNTGRDIQHRLRHSDSTIIDTEHADIVDERTRSDRLYHWTSYLYIIGLRPNRPFAEMITELQRALDLIGAPEDDTPGSFHNGLFVDTEFTQLLYGSHNWQSKRHTGVKDTTTGYYVKTVNRHLYGTFYIHSACNGTILPAISKVRVKEKVYYFQCIPEPTNIEKLQLPAKYPPLCVLRGIPANKDRHALTAAALFTVERALNCNFPVGSYAINPVQIYHKVGVDKFHDHAWVTPDMSSTTTHRIVNVTELVWEIIFLGTEEGLQDGVKSPRYTMAQANMFDQAQAKAAMTDRPHVIKIEGFTFEVLGSIRECLTHPQRARAFTASNCTTIYHIPEAALARDIIMCLSTSSDNIHAINEMANAITLPPVIKAKAPIPWRLLILWETTVEDIDLGPLVQIRSKINSKVAVLPGYDTVFMLQAMYESRRVLQETTKVYTDGKQDDRDTSTDESPTTTNTLDTEKMDIIEPASNAPSTSSCPMDETTPTRTSIPTRTMTNPMHRTGRGGRGDHITHSRTITATQQIRETSTELTKRSTYSDAVSSNSREVVLHNLNIDTYIQERIDQALAKHQAENTMQMNQLKTSILETMDNKIQSAQQGNARILLRQLSETYCQSASKLIKRQRKLDQDRRKTAVLQGHDLQIQLEEIEHAAIEVQVEKERLKKLRMQILEDAHNHNIDVDDLPVF